ncbi:EF-hand domain-containing protein [Psidium guajava]|nr:EF-hand domain-containing protein [Psidium guajava]
MVKLLVTSISLLLFLLSAETSPSNHHVHSVFPFGPTTSASLSFPCKSRQIFIISSTNFLNTSFTIHARKECSRARLHLQLPLLLGVFFLRQDLRLGCLLLLPLLLSATVGSDTAHASPRPLGVAAARVPVAAGLSASACCCVAASFPWVLLPPVICNCCSNLTCRCCVLFFPLGWPVAAPPTRELVPALPSSLSTSSSGSLWPSSPPHPATAGPSCSVELFGGRRVTVVVGKPS